MSQLHPPASYFSPGQLSFKPRNPTDPINTGTTIYSGYNSLQLQLLEKIYRRYKNFDSFVKKVANPENYLGEGMESKAYQIPGMDYILLVPKPKGDDLRNKIFRNKIFGLAFPEPVQDMVEGIGGPVLKSGPFSIVEQQPGFVTKIRPALFDLGGYYTQDAKITRKYRAKYRRYLKKVAGIPQSGYDELARDLIRIKPYKKLGFDPDASNITVDEEHGRFGLFDCRNQFPHPTEHFQSMLRTLINAKYVAIDENAVRVTGKRKEISVASDPELIELRKIIFKKCVIAAGNNGLEVFRSVRKEGFNPAFAWQYEEYLCRISGLHGKWPEIYKKLTQSRTAALSVMA
jgi:hypothetical protein